MSWACCGSGIHRPHKYPNNPQQRDGNSRQHVHKSRRHVNNSRQHDISKLYITQQIDPHLFWNWKMTLYHLYYIISVVTNRRERNDTKFSRSSVCLSVCLSVCMVFHLAYLFAEQGVLRLGSSEYRHF
jgi:hypothetical protein